MMRGMLGFGVLLAVAGGVTSARQQAAGAVQIDGDDLGGIVASTNGPEAGVWVIAETTDLPTKFARIVVTDERGRYVIPDLPKAGYTVFVRGYGLVDSARVQSAPGRNLNLTAVVAPVLTRPRSIIRPVTGRPCSRCLPRASSREPARKATASRPR